MSRVEVHRYEQWSDTFLFKRDSSPKNFNSSFALIATHKWMTFFCRTQRGYHWDISPNIFYCFPQNYIQVLSGIKDDIIFFFGRTILLPSDYELFCINSLCNITKVLLFTYFSMHAEIHTHKHTHTHTMLSIEDQMKECSQTFGRVYFPNVYKGSKVFILDEKLIISKFRLSLS